MQSINGTQYAVWRSFLLWSTAFIATRICFLYYPFHGERDIYLMAQSIYYNLVTQQGLSGPFFYGKSFSFGYYLLIFQVLSIAPYFKSDLELLLMLITFISSLVIICCALMLFRRFKLSTLQSIAFMALWVFSPVWWECTTYSHPIVPAFAFFLAGSAVLSRSKTSDRLVKTLSLSTIGSCLFFLSFSFRAETMLLLPCFLVLCVRGRSWREMILLMAPMMVAIVLFFFVQHQVLVHSVSSGLLDSNQKGSALVALVGFLAAWINANALLKGVVAAIFSFGIVSTALLPIGVYVALKKRAYYYLTTMAALIVPLLAFWLLNPTPFRHFLLVVVGLAGIASFFFLAVPKRIAVLLLIVVTLGNFTVPELLRSPILKVYAMNYPNLERIAGRPYGAIPIGSPVLNHNAWRQVLEYCEKEFWYIQTLHQSKIIFVGRDSLFLLTNYIKQSRSCQLSPIENAGILRLTTGNRTLYFVDDNYFPSGKLYETVIGKLGADYAREFSWYVNPLMQSRATLSEVLPDGIRVIAPFSQ